MVVFWLWVYKRKTAPHAAPLSLNPLENRLRDFLNLAVLNTGSADAQPLGSSLYERPNILKIHIPAAVGDIMRMADAASELRSPSAYLTGFSH
jgi:hypothetical protein